MDLFETLASGFPTDSDYSECGIVMEDFLDEDPTSMEHVMQMNRNCEVLKKLGVVKKLHMA